MTKAEYVNLNEIAKKNNRRIDKWLANKSTKYLISKFEKKLSKSVLIAKKGGKNHGGSWAHPLIAKEFETWCIKRRTKSREKDIQLQLFKKIGGDIEVPIEAGIIDILTSTEIIEVKHIKYWLHAVGQIIVYGQEFPNLQKHIHLFGKADKDFKHFVESRCSDLNIKVTWG